MHVNFVILTFFLFQLRRLYIFKIASFILII